MEKRFSPKLLNRALKLTTEWGENFGKPIDDRIRADYPKLTDEDIAALTAIAKETESYIYALAESELNGEIVEADIIPKARLKFDWLDSENTARHKNIGMFYARK